MNKNVERIFKYLAVYMGASLDIHSSLLLTMRGVRPGVLRAGLEKVEADMRKGRPVHESFLHLREGRHIDEVCWSLVSTAEQSGNMSASFMRVSEYVGQHLKMRSSLIGALVYPVGMLFVSLSMVYFLVSVVFPKIVPLFSSMGVALPLMARSVLGVSKLISSYGAQILSLFAIAGTAATFLFFRNSQFRSIIQTLYMSVPYVGQAARAKEYQRISLILGLLMHNNKTLHESMAVAAEASTFLPFKESLGNIVGALQRGISMSDELERQPLFHRDWIDLVTVGEATGTLPKTFSDLSEIYSEKYKDDVQTLVRVSEPVALACSAAVVLVVALAVIQPMYSLIQHINN